MADKNSADGDGAQEYEAKIKRDKADGVTNSSVPDQSAKSGGGGGFLTGLLLGGALGTLLAFLYAPQGGDETRGLIKQKANDLSDTAKAKAADITGKANDTADSAKSKVNEVTDAVKAKAADLSAKATDTVTSVKGNAQDLVDRTKAVAEDQKSRISEAVGAGKQAAQETKDQLTAQAEQPVEHRTVSQ